MSAAGMGCCLLAQFSFLFFLLPLIPDNTNQKIPVLDQVPHCCQPMPLQGYCLYSFVQLCISFVLYQNYFFRQPVKHYQQAAGVDALLCRYGAKGWLQGFFRKLNQCVKKRISLSKMIFCEHVGKIHAEYLFVALPCCTEQAQSVNKPDCQVTNKARSQRHFCVQLTTEAPTCVTK